MNGKLAYDPRIGTEMGNCKGVPAAAWGNCRKSVARRGFLRSFPKPAAQSYLGPLRIRTNAHPQVLAGKQVDSSFVDGTLKTLIFGLMGSLVRLSKSYRSRAFLLCSLFLLALSPFKAVAQFSFVTNNGAITITGYSGLSNAVIIPGTTNGFPVTSIGNSAFYDKGFVSSVVIPNSVTNIGNNAFESSGLTNVTFGTGVLNIGNRAFRGTKLLLIAIPDSVLTIGDQAFLSCFFATNALIGASVGSIGESAFQDCSLLASITISDSVTNIGARAFDSCVRLSNVTIPHSVISIGEAAFQLASSLQAIDVDPLNAHYSSVDGVLLNKSQTTLLKFPQGKTGVLTIPETVTSIASFALDFCNSLTSATIPDSVTNIAGDAFSYSPSLTDITVDGQNAFYSSVDGILFNKSQTTLILCPDRKVGSIAIPAGVVTIGHAAFRDCTNLTSVVIPDTVTSIDAEAFFSCENLSFLSIGNSVTNIESYAFTYCFNLTNVLIPDSVTSIGTSTFTGCGSMTGVTLSDGLVDLGSYAFENCISLTSIVIPEGVTNIRSAAFFGCRSLTNVTLGGRVKSIGSYAFRNCSNLARVTIPISVTSIGGFAFADCRSLDSVTILGTVTNIDNFAFSSCTNLTSVFFGGDAPSQVGTTIFAGNAKAFIYYLPGKTGWSGTFGGRPTKLWNPSIQTSNVSFGIQPSGFGLPITGTTNIPIVIEAASSLPGSDWTPLQSCTVTNGSIFFSDSQWSNHPSRYYRIRSP